MQTMIRGSFIRLQIHRSIKNNAFILIRKQLYKMMTFTHIKWQNVNQNYLLILWKHEFMSAKLPQAYQNVSSALLFDIKSGSFRMALNQWNSKNLYSCLRGYCTSYPKISGFVLYHKIIITFFEKYVQVIVNCPRNTKIASKFR